MAASKIITTIGHHGYWGNSSGFNFLDLLPFIDNNDDNNEEPLNILLVSPGDIRHIMYTIARRRRNNTNTNTNRSINFYILEQPLEILAREMILLQILFDFELPIRQRSNTFLEVYGNSLLQERTYKYISNIALQLHTFITKNTSTMSTTSTTNSKSKSKKSHVDVEVEVESFLSNIINKW